MFLRHVLIIQNTPIHASLNCLSRVERSYSIVNIKQFQNKFGSGTYSSFPHLRGFLH